MQWHLFVRLVGLVGLVGLLRLLRNARGKHRLLKDDC
jgi:hypothetical protein